MLPEITQRSIEDIQETLFQGEQPLAWETCKGLSGKAAVTASLLRQEYGELKKVTAISLASYFLSFLVLFFQKKGAVTTADLLKNEGLHALIQFLGDILIKEDTHYAGLKNTKDKRTAAFLDLWLNGNAPFSAQKAKDNLILDLLIRFDQLHATRLSSRLMNDIQYTVYSLAMLDDRLSGPEERFLDFLHKESAKVKAVIGDDSSFDVAAYGNTLKAENAEQMLKKAHEELEELIGLEAIKHEFAKLSAFLKIQKRREELGLPTTGLTLHFVFRGNPGTGKTTITRILGKLFCGMGYLDKGHVVETDRAGLVAEYLGQTAVKTTAKAREALDGILFVDEAYTLSREAGGSGNDAYGREAVETILKFMEDNRKRIVVVAAGYPRLMNAFVDTNPGLKSRFTRFLDFEDFQPVQLCQIMQLSAKKGAYRFSEDGITALSVLFSRACEQKTESFGNARFVRNLFEQTLQNQAMRLAQKHEPLSREELALLLPADLPMELETGPVSLSGDETACPWCKACERRQPHCPQGA